MTAAHAMYLNDSGRAFRCAPIWERAPQQWRAVCRAFAAGQDALAIAQRWGVTRRHVYRWRAKWRSA